MSRIPNRTKQYGTGLILFNGGVQQWGDAIVMPKNRLQRGEDIHISDGLTKRPGRRKYSAQFADGFQGVHEYIDPDNVARILVKSGQKIYEIDGVTKTERDTGLTADERVHFFSHRGRCRYYGTTTMRKITRTVADRVGIAAPADPPGLAALGGTTLTGDYAYKTTFVINDGSGNLLWESNPSPAAMISPAGKDVTVTPQVPADARVNAHRIYRTTNGGALYSFAGEITVAAATFTDNVTDANLGDPVETNHGVPAAASIGEGANERQFFISGSKLRWSENAYTESYLEYELEASFKELPGRGWGTGLKALYNISTGRQDLLVFQETSLHLLPGGDPLQPLITISKIYGTVAHDSIVEYNGGVVFITKDNSLCYYKDGAVLNITQNLLPTDMGALLNTGNATAALLYGSYYALCCQKDASKIYNHQVWVFDLKTVKALEGYIGFGQCECYRWNIDADYLLWTSTGSLLAFDNHSGYVFEYSLTNYDDVNADDTKGEITAIWRVPYLTKGFYTISQPRTIRVKGRQQGEITITPYFLGDFSRVEQAMNLNIVGSVAIAGKAIAGKSQASQIKEHVEAYFYNDQAGEVFCVEFQKAGTDPMFKLTGYELVYTTFSRV